MRIAGFLDKKQVPNVSSAKRNPASQAAEAMMARAPPSREPWKKSPTIPSKRWTRTVPASSKRVNWKYFWKGKFAHSLLGTRNRYWKGPKTGMSSLSHPIDRNPYRGKREMTEHFWLPSIRIRGYRPFKDALFRFEPLQVVVGANGTGKSSLFEFLKFLRDACRQEIPPEIVPGTIGQRIFHKPGPDKFEWEAEIVSETTIMYSGELMGPAGAGKVVAERVAGKKRSFGSLRENSGMEYVYLDFRMGKGKVGDPRKNEGACKEWDLKKTNMLGLGAMSDSSLALLFDLREYVRGWRFFNAFHINTEKIKKSVPTSQNPVLDEDAGNLSAVLLFLMTEHPENLEELKSVLKAAIPGFESLTVKARGGPGEVIAFWKEKSVDADLNLADLSDGTLRFIVWATACVMPNPPSLICIDEPDLGVHPRTLPVLAGLFEKASRRTQVILATHSSYFLNQFDLEQIAVMKKADGECSFLRVEDSRTLLDNLEDFGAEELERMHQNDELESLA